MSYILDALKKSEQQRGHGKAPGVQTIHSSSLQYGNRQKAWWPYVLIVAVLLNFTAILYFVIDREPEPASTATAPATVIIQQPETVQTAATIPVEPVPAQFSSPVQVSRAEPVSHQPAQIETEDSTAIQGTLPLAAQNQVTPIALSKTRQVEQKADVQQDNQEVIDFYELPETTRQQLPVLAVTGHIYSSNPLQRSIVINNNFMEEGEYVIDGLILDEITPDGAILEYEGTRFHYSVVSGWQ